VLCLSPQKLSFARELSVADDYALYPILLLLGGPVDSLRPEKNQLVAGDLQAIPTVII
jgi:hypothetical protein